MIHLNVIQNGPKGIKNGYLQWVFYKTLTIFYAQTIKWLYHKGILYNEENSMLETAFKSSVDVAKAKMIASGVELDVISKVVPLYDSFETQHHGKRYVILYSLISYKVFVVCYLSKYAKCSPRAWLECSGHPPETRLPSFNPFATTRKSLTYRPDGTSTKNEGLVKLICTLTRALWLKWLLLYYKYLLYMSKAGYPRLVLSD